MHSIHLRQPWKSEPCDGGVLWSRSFNWTAPLGPTERVRLVLEPLPASARITLSGKPLGGGLDITDHLQGHNLLQVFLDGQETDELPFAVRLEITAK
jgi:hypothetical protein